MPTVVVTMNEKDTLSNATAAVDLQHVLNAANPDLGGLQEWNKNRDGILEAITTQHGYDWARGPRGGGPGFWRDTRYQLRATRSVRLAHPEYVGHLPGRRARLGTSWATEIILDDLTQKRQTVLLVYHLTAEVQDVRGGGGYKTDPAHWLRVMRHKREKRRLGRRARFHQRRGRRVFPLGDSNYSGMALGGFVNCWDGYPGGSLGGRPVDIVFGSFQPSRAPRTYKTHSDHLAVAVDYP